MKAYEYEVIITTSGASVFPLDSQALVIIQILCIETFFALIKSADEINMNIIRHEQPAKLYLLKNLHPSSSYYPRKY